MSTFPETLGLGRVISRELKEEIEYRYNTYGELEKQAADTTPAKIVLDQMRRIAELEKVIMMLRAKLSEIAWSNDSEWQSDCAVQALAAIDKELGK